jgi:protocatechuate 3,4-dioxygenase beta subunit
MGLRSRNALVLALALLPALAFGQRTTTGTVAGKIIDSSGAVVPGVTISVSSPEALGQFSAVSDAQGIYRVTNLPPATYDIRAELAGFRPSSGRRLSA